MRLTDFSADSPGTLVPTINGLQAFVPDVLPPEIAVADLVPDLQAATLALGELKGAISPLANPELVIRPMQLREAVSSSNMEGTFTTFTDLLVFDAGGLSDPRQDTVEVHNYLKALRHADKLLQDLPVCSRLITELHKTLLSNLTKKGRGAAVEPGFLKKHQNFIGGTPKSPRFVPPPPAEAAKALSELETFINRPDRKGLELIDAALIHYQFETIHPFPDGNGRVGRILIPVYLQATGIIDGPYLYMSEYFERHKDEYIDLMYSVSSSNGWISWIKFFLNGVQDSSRSAITTTKQLIICSDFFRQQIMAGRGRSAVLVQIMDLLLSHPVLSVAQIAHRIGQSDQTVRNNLGWLIENDLVRELNHHRPKLYISPLVLDIISGHQEQV